MEKSLRELLLKDLCARLPYGVQIKIGEYSDYMLYAIAPNRQIPVTVRLVEKGREYDIDVSIENVKPYLRPMLSMTEEESKEFALLQTDFYVDGFLYPIAAINMVNWLNEHHFDVRNLIEKGLAIDCTGLNIY